MADDPSLDIAIRTTADLAGAKAAQRAVGDLAGSQKEFAQKTGEATEATKEQEKHLEGGQLLMAELNRIVPGLGHAMHAAFLGPVGPALALAMVVMEVKRSIDETSRALDEMGNKAAEADFLPGMESKLEVLRRATEAAASYALKLADVKTGEHGVTTELASQLALDQAVERARASQMSAQKGLDIAKIQADEKSGKLSPQKAAEARLALEKKYNDQELEANQKSQAAELERKQAALAGAQQNARGLESAQRVAADAVATDAAHKAKLQTNYGNTEQYLKSLDEAQKEKEAGESALRKAKRHSFWVRGTQGSAADQEWSAAELQIAQAEAKANALHAGRKQYEDSISEPSVAHSAFLKSEQEKTTAAANENAAAIGKLNIEIPLLRQAIEATRPIETQTRDIKNQTLDVNESAATADRFKADVQTIEDYTNQPKHDPKALERAAAAVKELNEILAGHREFFQMLSGLGTTVRELSSAQAQVARDVAVAQQTANRALNYSNLH